MVVDDITRSAGGSLAIQAQFAEELVDPKIVHVLKQVTALPKFRKGGPMLLCSKFETHSLETLNNYLPFSLS